jgi:hypothetical protein
MSDRYSIHFHVWTGPEFHAFLEHVKAKHLSQLMVIDSLGNGKESIFVLQHHSANT